MRMIDADVLMDDIRKHGESYFADDFAHIWVDKQPTVEAKPIRHAHWIWKGDEGDSRFMCSECKCKEYVPTCMGVPNIWEYCPNCGARMDEERNEE